MRLLSVSRLLHQLIVIPHGLEKTVTEQSIDVGDEDSLAILKIANLVLRLGVSFRLSVREGRVLHFKFININKAPIKFN